MPHTAMPHTLYHTPNQYKIKLLVQYNYLADRHILCVCVKLDPPFAERSERQEVLALANSPRLCRIPTTTICGLN